MNYSSKNLFLILDDANHLSNIDRTSEHFLHLVGVNMHETNKTPNKHIHNELFAADEKIQQNFIDQTPTDIYVKENITKYSTKNQQDLKNTGNITQPTLATLPLTHIPRIGVICYVPRGTGQAFTFLTMLFGSWKYLISNRN